MTTCSFLYRAILPNSVSLFSIYRDSDPGVVCITTILTFISRSFEVLVMVTEPLQKERAKFAAELGVFHYCAVTNGYTFIQAVTKKLNVESLTNSAERHGI